MTPLHVVRVFVDDGGDHGNLLGVFLSGGAVRTELRQQVAADLGYSETVFVDDVASGALRIFTPAVELPLAGHPLVGTGWLLAHVGRPAATLLPPAGPVPVRFDPDGLTWITADPASAPQWQLHELPSAADVESLQRDPLPGGATCAWAWADRDAGVIRARVFGSRFGIKEDQATGTAAMLLTAHVGRDTRILQGAGSVILGRLQAGGRVAIGGGTVLVEQRPYALPR